MRGYALDPCTEPNLFTVARIGSVIEDIRGDIRDAATLERAIQDFAPEVVFHLAAQPLVRYSYEDPIGTYETNVIGTAKVLDAVRRTPCVRAVVSVTTDKCYENKEWIWPYRETDPLGGYDPYSSSKACAEIVTAAFRQSYFPVHHLGQPDGHSVAIATARAGNVIGGGDWSTDRLLPDLVRGFLSGQPVGIRQPPRHPPLAACPRAAPRLHPARRKTPHPQPALRHRLQLRPLGQRRPPRRLDRRPDDRLLGQRRLLGPRRDAQPHTKPATSSWTPAAPTTISTGPRSLASSRRSSCSSAGTAPGSPAQTCTPSPSTRSRNIANGTEGHGLADGNECGIGTARLSPPYQAA